ncbi:flagellar biosynthetic protein FliR [Aestuariibius sp. HNIBRBA575]|uniref:flagellar biosynthetic protein FliR n=1 Tax=Aestuariibius sp. HNIBRBA575 TaxID=3233343 RepID=UPI0034A2A66C
MTFELLQFIEKYNDSAAGLFLVFLRVSGAMSLVPAFGDQMVPVRVKLVMAVMFTLVVYPAIAQTAYLPIDAGIGFIPIILSEIAVGLFFGLFLRMFILTLQMAGTMAAQSTSLSQIFGGSAGNDPQPAMAHLLVISGVALATLLGLHVHIANYLILTYGFVPAGEFPSSEIVAEIGISQITTAFASAFTLAAPFIIASLLYNVTLGIINRAMPQLMVAFVGAPAITAAGLALLMISSPLILSVWSATFLDFMSSPFGGTYE